MNSQAVCQDDGKVKEDDGGMDAIECSCTCPVVSKMEKMSSKDYCDPANDLMCVFNTASCADLKKSMSKSSPDDFKTQLSLHCERIDLNCEEQEAKMMTCGGDSLTQWMTQGCEDAAKDQTLESKSEKCCEYGDELAKCVDAKCTQLRLLSSKIDRKTASEDRAEEIDKDMAKSFEIGKVCPNTGMPASEGDLTGDSATSSAWASVLHASPFVVIVGGLLA